MKKINVDFKSDILPHLLAIVFFLIITLIFFSPLLLEEKTLTQPDILQWEGGAKELLDYRAETGEEGLWTNSMFGGMPGYLVNTKFSGNLIVHVESLFTLFLPSPARIIFSAFLSFYILLIAFGVRPLLAVGGAIIFGLTSYNIIGLTAGHNYRIAAISYMPLVIAGVHLAFQKKYWWGFILTGLGLALHLNVNHVQITYYLLLMVLLYGLIHLIFAIKEKQLNTFAKTVGLLSVAAILGVGCNLGKMWTIAEYSQYSIRGKSELTKGNDSNQSQQGLAKDYAFQYSNGIMEPFVLFVPDFMGGSSVQELGKDSNLGRALKSNGVPPAQVSQQLKAVPTYWGNQPGTKPYYVGAIAVFLFVIGIFVVDKPLKIWLIICVLLGIVLSWGDSFSSFNYFIFDYLPGYNKLRSVTFTIIITIFSLTLLGFIGLEKLLKSGLNQKTQRYLLLSLGITGGITLLMVFYSWIGGFRGAIDAREPYSSYPIWFLDALRQDRASLLRNDALRSLFFIIGSVSLIYFYFKKKLSEIAFSALFILLITLDTGLVSSRFIGSENFNKNPKRAFFHESEADKLIRRDKTLSYRVFDLTDPFNNAQTSYFHKSLGGYHGAKIRRYQDLIEKCISEEINAWIGEVQKGGTDMENYGVLNMLNTKYFKAGNTANAVIQNPDNNGNAWLVSEVRKVNNPDEEIDALKEIDTKKVAVIDISQNELPTATMNGTGTVQLEEYQPNYLKYKADLSGDGLAVFSEIFYPAGWEATIDGEPVDILRANYVLRALPIKSGNHVIEFFFKPNSYYTGNKVMLVSNLILIIVILAGIGISLRRELM
ncbi:YfhO family protein [Fulvivirgaceae bacterium BMA12]|uniref:YfhO family protein n=1 Tax=Agaribacillus aureus TaxID=3051825 RepID=A0ABT8L8Y3_9BACT|nr:YfhO family protein [Fulvivirgaceae bacterium BMA12]